MSLAANSRIYLRSFDYDVVAAKRVLQVELAQGQIRVSASNVEMAGPVEIIAGGADVTVNDGAVSLSLAPGGNLEALLLYGSGMAVESNDEVQIARRPGSQVLVAAGAAPQEAQLESIDDKAFTPAMEIPARVRVAGDSGAEASGGFSLYRIGVRVLALAGSASNLFLGGLSRDLINGIFRAGLVDQPAVPDLFGGFPGDIGRFSTEFASQDSRQFFATAGLSGGVSLPGDLRGALFLSDGVQNSAIGGPPVNIAFFDGFAFNGSLFFGNGGEANSGLQRVSLADGRFPVTTGFSGIGDFSGEGFLDPEQQFASFRLSAGEDNRALLFAGVPTVRLPSTGVQGYLLDDDFLRGADVPFAGHFVGNSADGPAGGSAFGATPAYIAWNRFTQDQAVGLGSSAFAAGKVVISGQGAGQSIIGSLLVGGVNAQPGDQFLAGEAYGFARQGDGPLISSRGFFTHAVPETPSGAGGFFGEHADFFVIRSDGDDIRSSAGGQPTGEAVVSALNIVRQSDLITSALVESDSRNLSGFTAGLAGTYDLAGRFLEYVPVAGSDFRAHPDRRETGINLTTDALANRLTGHVSASRGFATDVVIDGPGKVSISWTIGDLGSIGGATAFIDDDRFLALQSDPVFQPAIFNGAIADSSNFALFSSGFVEFRNLTGAETRLCDCQYLSWGGWVGGLADSTRFVQAEPAFWVAGEMPDAAAIAALAGTASYSGHVITSVVNGSGPAASLYVAVGGFNMTYDFDGGPSRFSVLDLDGTNYVGTVVGAGAGREEFFRASAFDGATKRVIDLQGAFFGAAGQLNIAAGGQVRVGGPDYKAAGIFAADRVSNLP